MLGKLDLQKKKKKGKATNLEIFFKYMSFVFLLMGCVEKLKMGKHKKLSLGKQAGEHLLCRNGEGLAFTVSVVPVLHFLSLKNS